MILGWLTDFAAQCWPFLGLALLFVFGALLWPNRFFTTWDTWAGIGCYVLSFLFATSFMLVDREHHTLRVALWQIGIMATLIMYASVIVWQASKKPPAYWRHGLALFVGLVCLFSFLSAGMAPITEPIGVRRSLEMTGSLLIVLLVGVVLWNLPRPSKTSYILPTGHLIWVFVLIAEFWAAWEYLDCAILGGSAIQAVDAQLQLGFEHSACGDKYGIAYLWIQQILIGAAMVAVLIWHHRRLRPWAY